MKGRLAGKLAEAALETLNQAPCEAKKEKLTKAFVGEMNKMGVEVTVKPLVEEDGTGPFAY